MVLSLVSLIALALMLAAVAVGWSRRFLAVGALAIANVAVLILSSLGPQVPGEGLSFIQAELGLWSPNLADEPALGLLQLFSSMFVHADFFHLLGNLIILLAFALPFEERIGHRRFLLVYLLSGFIGALVQVGVSSDQPILLMGASGAVAGVIGAFAASYPNLIVPLPVPLLFIMVFMRIRVWVGAILFLALQLVLMSVSSGGGVQDNTAYFAHLGGLAGGILAGYMLVRGKVRAHRNPVAVDLGALGPFASDTGTSQALAQMKANHDEPQIFQAWLDRFFRTATCPTCQHKVMPRHHGEIVCTQGHRFDVRQDKRKAIAA